MGRTVFTEPQCRYNRAIPLLPLWAVRPLQSLSACTVEVYFYSLYGPYCLYRASVPVQYSYTSTPPMGRTACTKPQFLYSRAITQLPLRAVRPVQSLSACTVALYLYSPYGPYGLYRTSVPVQRCTFTFTFTLLTKLNILFICNKKNVMRIICWEWVHAVWNMSKKLSLDFP